MKPLSVWTCPMRPPFEVAEATYAASMRPTLRQRRGQNGVVSAQREASRLGLPLGPRDARADARGAHYRPQCLGDRAAADLRRRAAIEPGERAHVDEPRPSQAQRRDRVDVGRVLRVGAREILRIRTTGLQL